MKTLRLMRAAHVIQQPHQDSGELLPIDSQARYWQQRTFEAEQRAGFAEACAVVFFICFVIYAVVMALV
jgi:hypothetical protein